MGFNLENCEVWFERAVIGVMTLTAVVIMVRVSRNILAIYLPNYSACAPCGSPLSCNLGPFRDFHLQLLFPPLPLSIVDDVYGITFRGL